MAAVIRIAAPKPAVDRNLCVCLGAGVGVLACGGAREVSANYSLLGHLLTHLYSPLCFIS